MGEGRTMHRRKPDLDAQSSLISAQSMCVTADAEEECDLSLPPACVVPEAAAQSPPRRLEYLRGLSRHAMRVCVVVHLCAGEKRDEDVEGWLSQLAGGLALVVSSLELVMMDRGLAFSIKVMIY